MSCRVGTAQRLSEEQDAGLDLKVRGGFLSPKLLSLGLAGGGDGIKEWMGMGRGEWAARMGQMAGSPLYAHIPDLLIHLLATTHLEPPNQYLPGFCHCLWTHREVKILELPNTHLPH